MTRRHFLKPLLTFTIIILAGCQTMDPTGFSSLRYPFTPSEAQAVSEESSAKESYADQIVLLAPLLGETEDAIEPVAVDEENGPSDAFLAEEEEIPLPSIEETVEAVLSASEAVPEPTVMEDLPEPSTDITLPEPNVVRLGANWELPMWFCYTTAGLFLACLFTICYIAKQRKEAYWRKFRD